MATKRQQRVQREQEHCLQSFIEKALRDRSLDESDLLALVGLKVPEGLRLEYKEAAWCDKDYRRRVGPGHPSPLRARVSKYVAGFANAAGGVLIVGLKEARDEDGRFVGVAPNPVKENTESYTQAVKSGMAGLHPFLPRAHAFHTVPADGGGVYYVLAVDRSVQLVPCHESGHLVYFLRLQDSTVSAPDYLAADLFLGRRRVPVVEVVQQPTVTTQRHRERPVVEMGFSLQLRNVGLTWMDRPRVGIVGYTKNKQGVALHDQLRRELRLRHSAYGLHGEIPDPRILGLKVKPKELETGLGPYDSFTVRTWQNPFLLDRYAEQILWGGALYIVGHNQIPLWYQLIVLLRRGEENLGWALPCGELPPVSAVHNASGWGGWMPELDWIEWIKVDEGVVPALADYRDAGDEE